MPVAPTQENEMDSSEQHNSGALHPIPALLISESQNEFAALCGELDQDIQPQGVIERTYVNDIAYIIWDILRLRRYKTVIIDYSRFVALQGILKQLLCHRDYEHSYQKDIDAEDLARSWFDSKKAQA